MPAAQQQGTTAHPQPTQQRLVYDTQAIGYPLLQAQQAQQVQQMQQTQQAQQAQQAQQLPQAYQVQYQQHQQGTDTDMAASQGSALYGNVGNAQVVTQAQPDGAASYSYQTQQQAPQQQNVVIDGTLQGAQQQQQQQQQQQPYTGTQGARLLPQQQQDYVQYQQPAATSQQAQVLSYDYAAQFLQPSMPSHTVQAAPSALSGASTQGASTSVELRKYAPPSVSAYAGSVITSYAGHQAQNAAGSRAVHGYAAGYPGALIGVPTPAGYGGTVQQAGSVQYAGQQTHYVSYATQQAPASSAGQYTMYPHYAP